MNNTWVIIENWLDENAPQMKAALNTGVTNEDVVQLEALIGAKLPEDFVAFYKVHNGQDPREGGLINTEELLSFDRIKDEWGIWKDLLDKNTFTDDNGVPYQSDSDAEIKPDWWNPLWIPITYDGSGNHYCLDLDPGRNGHYGQIIRMWHDDAERSFEADSFGAWIKEYARKLQRDEYMYSDDWGGIILRSEVE
jgi:cell wall assembly regulator SMI1